MRQMIEQQDVFNEMDTISIFDDDKMIVIENATFLSSKDTTKYDIKGFYRSKHK